MWPYSLYHEQMSLLNTIDYRVKIPTDQHHQDNKWYPLVLVYHDENGFSRWKGEPWALTVLYRFGGFSRWNRSSSYFDQASPRFSSFYGAYLIQHKENKAYSFGFSDDGYINIDQWLSVTEYDQRYLVMPSLGLAPQHVTFDVDIESVQKDVTYIGRDGWTQIDAVIHTNSPQHQYQRSQHGYLQYGYPVPPQRGQYDFETTRLYGRFYAIHDEEHHLSVGLYLLAPDGDTLEKIDTEELSRLTLPEHSLKNDI